MVQVGASDHLFEKHVEVKAALLDEVLIGVIHFTFARYWWHVQTRKSLEQRRPQQIKFFISSLYFERAVLVLTNDCVDDMVALCRLLRITHAELLSKLIRGKRLYY